VSATTSHWRSTAVGIHGRLAPAVAATSAAAGAGAVGMSTRADALAPAVLAAVSVGVLWLVLGFLDGRAALFGVLLALPLTAVAGGFVGLEPVELAVITASVLVVLRRLAIGLPILPWVSPLWWGVALLAWMLVSFLSSVDVDRSVKELIALAGGLLVASVALDVASDVRRLRHVLSGLVLVAAGIAVGALSSASELRAIEGGTIATGRLEAIFSQPNEFGLFVTMSTLAAVGLALGARTRLGLVALALALVPLGAALLLTVSRGAWLGLCVGLVVLFMALPRARRSLVIVVAVLAVLAVTPSYWAPGAAGRAVELRIASFFELSSQDQRSLEWAEAWRQLREDPLTGQGPGAFLAASGAPGSATRTTFPAHAHNLWLEWGAQGGFPAVLLVAGLVITVAARARRARRQLIASDLHRDAAVLAGAAAALVAVLVHGLVDYPLRNDVLWYTTWLLIGAFLGASSNAGRGTGAFQREGHGVTR
jgi:putative inorganic carbon (hco3(-)) transporter